MNGQETLNKEELATLAFLLYGTHPAADSSLADRMFEEHRGALPGTDALLPACSSTIRVAACNKGTRKEAAAALNGGADGYMVALVADRWPLVAAANAAADGDTLQAIVDRTAPGSVERDNVLGALTSNPAVQDMALSRQQADLQAAPQPEQR